MAITPVHNVIFKKEVEEVLAIEEKKDSKVYFTPLQLPLGKDKLSELQVPKLTMDWGQDQFWTQLNSPWLQNLTPYANILNF